MITCIQIPYFIAALEQRENPEWRDQPLIVEGPNSHVYAVSERAHQMGVAPGMSLQQAVSHCPEPVWAPARPPFYAHALEGLLTILADFTPHVEADGSLVSATCFADLGRPKPGSMTRVQAIGQAIRERASLAPAMGVADSRFAAHVAASLVRENEALLIAQGHEAEFLAPLPIALLPLDEEQQRRLRLLGIRTLEQLAALPIGAVLNQLGTNGRTIHQLAQGIDPRPVLAYRPQEEERIARQLDDPSSDLNVLEAELRSLAYKVAARLRDKVAAARDISLTLFLESGDVRQAKRTLQRPACDPERIFRNLRQLLGQIRLTQAVAGLEICLRGIASATGRQLDLFAQAAEQERLRCLLEDLVARYGADCFFRVSLTDQTARLPERRFQLRAPG